MQPAEYLDNKLLICVFRALLFIFFQFNTNLYQIYIFYEIPKFKSVRMSIQYNMQITVNHQSDDPRNLKKAFLSGKESSTPNHRLGIQCLWS